MESGAMTATASGSLTYRVARSSVFTVLGFGGSQFIRLASSLIMSRLLFPEAFGMMALITVFLVGIVMLSDLGIGPAIMQSQRGDDPDFLDTAWTIQIIRGTMLWLFALASTPIIAWFYKEPDLWYYLPVTAIGILIGAFRPTRLETANRHLQAGLVTVIDLATQVVGVIITITLAWMLQSVWALVIGNVAGALVNLILLNLLLPGHRNRFRWEPAATHELVHFGKWIFLSTVCGFVASQSDKVILGRYLDLDYFGLYSIAFYLANLPHLLGSVVTARVLIPIYRASPPAASAANAMRVRRLRMAALGVLLVLSAALTLGGGALVHLLYDPRYHAAAGMVVLLAVGQIPMLLFLTCDQAALAMGDSRRFFWLTMARAVLTTSGLLIGINLGGVTGAIIGQGLGNLATYPFLVWNLKPHGAWDPDLDALFLSAAGLVGAVALWLNQADLMLIP
jgi:O-antigen/teichoic acid export membrane protein